MGRKYWFCIWQQELYDRSMMGFTVRCLHLSLPLLKVFVTCEPTERFQKVSTLGLGLTYNLCVKMIATILLPQNYLLYQIAFTIFFLLKSTLVFITLKSYF